MDFINLENSGWNFVKKRDLVVNLNRLSEDKTWTNSMYLTHRSLTLPTCIDAIEEQLISLEDEFDLEKELGEGESSSAAEEEASSLGR